MMSSITQPTLPQLHPPGDQLNVPWDITPAQSLHCAQLGVDHIIHNVYFWWLFSGYKLSGLCWGIYCLWFWSLLQSISRTSPKFGMLQTSSSKGFAAQIIHIHSLQPAPRWCFWLKTEPFLLIARKTPDNFGNPLWSGLRWNEGDPGLVHVAGGQRRQPWKSISQKFTDLGTIWERFHGFFDLFILGAVFSCPLGFHARRTRFKQHLLDAEMGTQSRSLSSCAASVHGTLISPNPGALDLPAVERHKPLPVISFCILMWLVALLHKSRPPFLLSRDANSSGGRRQPGLLVLTMEFGGKRRKKRWVVRLRHSQLVEFQVE